MKTINDSYKLKLINEEISNLNNEIIQKKLLKQQLICRYTKQAQQITEHLIRLLNLNSTAEFSILFNLPYANNNNALMSWVMDYLIENEDNKSEPSSFLNNIISDLQSEIARKKQDYLVEFNNFHD